MSEATPRKVQILYSEGCPNVAPTTERVRSVADLLGVPVRIELVEIVDDQGARDGGFLGSTSVRVDGPHL